MLHKGHAFSALTAFEAAQQAGGRFVLRIEDIDFTRCRPEFEAAILEDLAWLGLAWEAPVLRQSEHVADYMAALDELRARGLVYRSFKTRKQILDEMPRAPRTVRRKATAARRCPPRKRPRDLPPASRSPGA